MLFLCQMPFYRIHIKLEGQEVKEFTIEDNRKDIEFVYLEYKRRVNAKNGAGRVIYFDLVMIAEASLSHQEDREEVFNPQNNFRINMDDIKRAEKRKDRRPAGKPLTLGERAKLREAEKR